MPEVTERTLDDIEKFLETLDAQDAENFNTEIVFLLQRSTILFHDVLYDAKRR